MCVLVFHVDPEHARSAIKSIRADIPRDESGVLFLQGVIEALSNLEKIGEESEVSVSCHVTAEKIETVIEAESYRVYYPLLANALSRAIQQVEKAKIEEKSGTRGNDNNKTSKSCPKGGKGSFFQEEHGLGHMFIAVGCSDVNYNEEEGKLIMYLDRLHPPQYGHYDLAFITS